MTIICSPPIDYWLDSLRGHGDALLDTHTAVQVQQRNSHDLTALQLDSSSVAGIDVLIQPELVWRAQELFSLYFTQVGAVFLHKVLPSAFAAARGAQAIYLTDSFLNDPAARIRRTTNFLFHIFAPPHREYLEAKAQLRTNLHSGGSGAQAALQVRAGHALTRAALQTLGTPLAERWANRASYFRDADPAGPPLGVPINQEDQLGMLLECTVGVFEGLELLGVPFTEEDRQAWYHVWDIVARYLGVCTLDALGYDVGERWVSGGPADRSESAAADRQGVRGDVPDLCPPFLPLHVDRSPLFLEEIRRRNHLPSFEGKVLINGLLDELQRPLSWDLKPFPRSLVRYLVGDDVADMLGVSPGGWAEHVVSQFRGVPRLRRLVMRSQFGWPVRAAVAEVSARSSRDIINQVLRMDSPDRGYRGPGVT